MQSLLSLWPDRAKRNIERGDISSAAWTVAHNHGERSGVIRKRRGHVGENFLSGGIECGDIQRDQAGRGDKQVDFAFEGGLTKVLAGDENCALWKIGFRAQNGDLAGGRADFALSGSQSSV